MQTNKNRVKTQQETPTGGLPRAKYVLGIGLLTLVAATSGCGNKAKLNLETANHMKSLCVAATLYHNDKKAWPDNLEQIKPYIGKEAPGLPDFSNGKDYAALIANPVTGDNPGYEYVKPKDDAPGRTTIMLYQLRGGKRDESLPVAFMDGSVRDAKSAP
jgi:hypothetical protein